MNIQQIESFLATLNPISHKSLRESLIKEIDRLSGKNEKTNIPNLGDQYANYFESKVDELNSRYVGGTLKEIEKRYPDLKRSLVEAENRVNTLWKKGLLGESTIDDFKRAVDEWFRLNMEAIDKFSKEILET